MAKSCIFHELIELSRDEEISVRIASLETLVDLLDFFEKSKSSRHVVKFLYMIRNHIVIKLMCCYVLVWFLAL